VQLRQDAVLWCQQQVVEMPFLDLAEGLSGVQYIASFALSTEIPAPATVKRKGVLSAGNEIATVLLKQGKWALQTIEDSAEQAGAESDCQWTLSSYHRFADTQASGLFKDLNCCDSAIEAHHFPGQATCTDKDSIADFQVRQIDTHGCTADTGDLAIHLCNLT
jgi:hypothetical protein